MDRLLTITEVSARTGLTAHTLRYYERAGLIAPVARTSGGQRRYDGSDLEWFEFLLRLRDTQMPIRQVRIFGSLRSQGSRTLTERRQMLQAHLSNVRDKLKSLRRAIEALERKIALYENLEVSLVAPAELSRPGHLGRAHES